MRCIENVQVSVHYPSYVTDLKRFVPRAPYLIEILNRTRKVSGEIMVDR
jgi:hypothetical protein